jgi:hypothetical protein
VPNMFDSLGMRSPLETGQGAVLEPAPTEQRH